MSKTKTYLTAITIALLPFILLILFGYIDLLLDLYRNKTYNSTYYFIWSIFYYALLGFTFAKVSCLKDASFKNKFIIVLSYLIGCFFILAILLYYPLYAFEIINPIIFIKIDLLHIINLRDALIMLGIYAFNAIRVIVAYRKAKINTTPSCVTNDVTGDTV